MKTDSMKEKNFISAVIYMHNEEARIAGFLEMINEVLSSNFLKYEIICVNDYCTDGSIEKVRECSGNVEGVLSILNMSYYQGIELSMNAGVDLAIGDFVFEFDSINADFDKEMIMQVYEKSLQGFDIVSAVPNEKMKLSSRFFYKLFNKFANMQYTLETESFRILSRRAINRVHSMSARIPYRKAMYANCGLKLFSLRYEINQSYLNGKVDFETRKTLAVDSLIIFTDIASRFTTFMSCLMLAVISFVALYACVIFVLGTPIEGWVTTMLFMSLCFFGTFLIMAIMVKYLSLLMNLTFSKQKYNFESIEKITK